MRGGQVVYRETVVRRGEYPGTHLCPYRGGVRGSFRSEFVVPLVTDVCVWVCI